MQWRETIEFEVLKCCQKLVTNKFSYTRLHKILLVKIQTKLWSTLKMIIILNLSELNSFVDFRNYDVE